MSGTPGHVIRKDGRIVELPDRVRAILKWHAGVAVAPPVVMMLAGIGAPDWVFPVWAGILLTILPFGIAVAALTAMLRQGQGGIFAYSVSITMMHYLSLTLQPHAASYVEMLAYRGVPLAAIVAALYFFRQDLHYNLRSFWYSMQAMQQLQEAMMKARARKDAKKRGETFDEGKVIDAEAVVRDWQARTGQELHPSMTGINLKPGFRQESKQKGASGASKKQRKKRK